ncbi:MAG: PEPxxWA-CTERM sorting domain-containing protein, partial [Sandaracinobacter sp.]
RDPITMKNLVKIGLLAAVAMAPTPAMAALTVFKQFTGKYGLSTDGGGHSTDGAGYGASNYTVNAWVPVGATVEGAWLYQSGYSFDSIPGPYPVFLNNQPLTFGSPMVNNSVDILFSARADVTSLVAPIINGGPGGTYSFNVRETRSGEDNALDGVALVVVYSDPSVIKKSTVAILDGFATVTGDEFTFTAPNGMNPTAPGFSAELRLGIGFSRDNTFQRTFMDVNGTQITRWAGGHDDGLGDLENGMMITVGGNNDPFSPFLPTEQQFDTERYNLVPYISQGDTSIRVNTRNPSQDDNIFLAAFIINEGSVTIPEPATWAMMIVGFGLVGFATRRRERLARVSA